VTVRTVEALTKAVVVTKRILLRLEEGHAPLLPSTTAAVDEVALNLFLINAALKEYEAAITTAADGRATISVSFADLYRNASNIPTSNKT